MIDSLRARSEMTILLTTHYLDEADRLCDRLAVMHEGRIVAMGSPAALRAELGESIVEMRVAGDPEAALAALRMHGIADDEAFTVGSTLTVPVRGRSATNVIAAVHALGLDTSSVAAREPTLDDVYLRLTGGRLAEAA